MANDGDLQIPGMSTGSEPSAPASSGSEPMIALDVTQQTRPFEPIKAPVLPDNADQKAILHAIYASNNNVNAKLLEMDRKSETRFQTLSISLKTWQQGVDKKLKDVEDTLTKREAFYNSFQQTIDYVEKTAKAVDAKATSYDNRFTAIDTEVSNAAAANLVSQKKTAWSLNAIERQMKENNVRIQGMIIPDEETPKLVVLRVFKAIIPDLEIEQIEYAYAIKSKPPEDPSQPARPPIILARFVSKGTRNAVFFKAKKNKDKIPANVIVREDYTKLDLELKTLAKPQMAVAFAAGKKPKFTFGSLKVDGQITKINGADALI